MARKRVAILISGRGSNMVALIEAAKDPSLSRRDRASSSRTIPTRAGLARAAEAGIATAVVDHKTFGKDREAFERALQARARGARHRAGVPRRLHAAADAVVRAAMAGPAHQHPPRPAAGLQGPRHPCPRAGGRRQRTRRDRAFRRARDGFRADHRAGQRCRCSPGDTEATLAARVLAVEHRIYPEALRLVAEGRVRQPSA